MEAYRAFAALYDRLIPRAAALLDKTLSRALPKP